MSISRRSLIGGAAATPSTHIASLVVRCRPERLQEAQAAISAMPAIEVPASNDHTKMVVLLEMTDESELLGGISRIESTPGVVSATLVFHQVDEFSEAL